MRPQILNPLFTGIEKLKGVGSKNFKLLRNLCGDKIVNLMWHLPYNVIDRTYSVPLRSASANKIWTGIIQVKEKAENVFMQNLLKLRKK